MEHGKRNPDERECVTYQAAPLVKRRHILKSGLATACAVAAGAIMSVVSCMSQLFSLTDDGVDS